MRIGYVPRQIHAVVQQPQHIDEMICSGGGNPKNDEMPSLAPFACDMQRVDIRADVVALAAAGEGGALRQVAQRSIS